MSDEIQENWRIQQYPPRIRQDIPGEVTFSYESAINLFTNYLESGFELDCFDQLSTCP